MLICVLFLNAFWIFMCLFILKTLSPCKQVVKNLSIVFLLAPIRALTYRDDVPIFKIELHTKINISFFFLIWINQLSNSNFSREQSDFTVDKEQNMQCWSHGKFYCWKNYSAQHHLSSPPTTSITTTATTNINTTAPRKIFDFRCNSMIHSSYS